MTPFSGRPFYGSPPPHPGLSMGGAPHMFRPTRPTPGPSSRSPPVAPRPGAPLWPLRPGARAPPSGCTFKVKNVFCFKLDAMSVPEALATTIRILLMFSIVLAHRWNPGASAHPDPSGMPHQHPIGTPSAPHPPPGHPADPPDSWVTVRRGVTPSEGGPPYKFRRGCPPLLDAS